MRLACYIFSENLDAQLYTVTLSQFHEGAKLRHVLMLVLFSKTKLYVEFCELGGYCFGGLNKKCLHQCSMTF